jgi:hypothetical protein
VNESPDPHTTSDWSYIKVNSYLSALQLPVMTTADLVQQSLCHYLSQGIHRGNRAEENSLSVNAFSSDDDFYGSDTPLKHPPRILFIVGLLSVVLGTLVGVYGIVSSETASNSQQYLVGIMGYLFTALFPIIILQMILSRHTKALALNQEQPYDSYAGGKMQGKFRKVVFAGLITAGLSIWVFFLPIAEKFAA